MKTDAIEKCLDACNLSVARDPITDEDYQKARAELAKREEPVVWVATLGYGRWCIVDEEDGHELCFIGATYAAKFNQAMSKSGITVREWTAPQPEPALPPEKRTCRNCNDYATICDWGPRKRRTGEGRTCPDWQLKPTTCDKCGSVL